MKRLSLILLSGIFLLFSCNSKSGNPDDRAAYNGEVLLPESTTEPPRTLEHMPSSENKDLPATEGNPNYNFEKDFEAIVIGDGVRFRKAPNRGSEVSFTGRFGDLVHIIETSNNREVIADEPHCDSFGYHWYKTTGADDNEGWIFGKFLYIRPEIGQLNTVEMQNWLSRLSGKEYIINGMAYRFDFAVDQSIGASDEDGLTGCDQMAYPLFYKANKQPIHFIKSKLIKGFEGRLPSERGYLQFLWDSEGGNDDVLGISVINADGKEKLEMKIKHYYQDGFSETTIVISVKNGIFQMESASNNGFQG